MPWLSRFDHCDAALVIFEDSLGWSDFPLGSLPRFLIGRLVAIHLQQLDSLEPPTADGKMLHIATKYSATDEPSDQSNQEGGVPTIIFGLEIHDRLLSYLFNQTVCPAPVSMCQQPTHSKGTAVKMNWIRSAEAWTYPDIHWQYPESLCIYVIVKSTNFWFCRLETSRSFFIVLWRGVGAYHTDAQPTEKEVTP